MWTQEGGIDVCHASVVRAQTKAPTSLLWATTQMHQCRPFKALLVLRAPTAGVYDTSSVLAPPVSVSREGLFTQLLLERSMMHTWCLMQVWLGQKTTNQKWFDREQTYFEYVIC